MDGGLLGSALLLGVCLVLSAFFSGSETAIFSLSTIQRRRLERAGQGAARTVTELLAQPKRLLVTILIGNMSVNTLSSSTATAVCLALLGDAGLGVAVPLMTVLLLIFGELTPKVLAVRTAESFSLRVAGPLRAFGRVIRLPVRAIEGLTDSVIDLLAPSRKSGEPVVTVDELSVLVKMGEESGELQRREKELVEFIFEFQETVVREIMTPRVEIDAVCRSWTAEGIRSAIRHSRSARMPVYTEDLDDIDGILITKRFLLSGAGSLDAFVERPYFIPEGKKVQELLQDFRERGIEMAVVLDEHGGVVGLVTLEDLLEEIFGEVYDEDDEDDEDFVSLPDGAFRILGRSSVDDASALLGVPLAEDDDEFDTVAGLCMARLGRIPWRGDEVVLPGWSLRVTKTVKRRVVEVVATPQPSALPPADGGEAHDG